MDVMLQQALDLHEEVLENLDTAKGRAASLETQLSALTAQNLQEKERADAAQRALETQLKANAELQAKVQALADDLDKEKVKVWAARQVKTPPPPCLLKSGKSRFTASRSSISPPSFRCTDDGRPAGLQEATGPWWAELEDR